MRLVPLTGVWWPGSWTLNVCRMKFKIEAGTETYVKLMALKKRMDAAHKAVNKVLDELGAQRYQAAYGAMLGGISAVELPSKPEGWVQVGARSSRLFYPSAKNTAWRDRLKALPTLKHDELNSVVGFNPQHRIDEDRMVWKRYKAPGIQFLKNAVLLDTGAADYTPPNADIVEILESEYRRLEQLANTKK